MWVYSTGTYRSATVQLRTSPERLESIAGQTQCGEPGTRLAPLGTPQVAAPAGTKGKGVFLHVGPKQPGRGGGQTPRTGHFWTLSHAKQPLNLPWPWQRLPTQVLPNMASPRLTLRRLAAGWFACTQCKNSPRTVLLGARGDS
uniref:Uncharacterized protein n=1 Tax=Eutreptiella gymnastica TaxID=73025 RepID=A0A7S1NCY0_9EUGL